MTVASLAIALDWLRHWSPSHMTTPLGLGLCATMVALVLAVLFTRNHHLRTEKPDTSRANTRSSAFHNMGAAARLSAMVHGSPNHNLSSLLAPYRFAPATSVGGREESNWSLFTTPRLRRFALALERIASRTSLAPKLDNALGRAGVRSRAGEIMAVWLLATVLLLTFGWTVAGPIGCALVATIAVVAPLAGLQGAAERRAKLFATQLPDILKLTASSLRAGFALLQGLEAVAKQLQEPSAGELQRVIIEARLGRPVEEALEAAAQRICNRDFTESVAAVRIQQEAGGNLASLFETLAETMLQRLQLRREIRTLTAEARLSAYVLAGLPLLIAGFLFATSPKYVLVLFHNQAGKIALLAALALQLLGFLWMFRTVKIED